MIVLQPSILAQQVNFTPRQSDYTNIYLTNETTGFEVEITALTSGSQSYYLFFTAIFDIEDGVFYTLKIVDSNTIVFLSRVFCTSQPVGTYTVNKNTYISEQLNNDFITI